MHDIQRNNKKWLGIPKTQTEHTTQRLLRIYCQEIGHDISNYQIILKGPSIEIVDGSWSIPILALKMIYLASKLN
jgi:hypothetical protein